MYTENTQRKFGSNKHYIRRVLRFRGEPTPMLFTDHAFAEAAERAKAQPEDAPKVRWWHWFMV